MPDVEKTIRIKISTTVYGLLKVLDSRGNVEEVIQQLIDHAQQGVYRPGAWERPWLISVFGYGWLERMEPGDPYGRADSQMFQKVKPDAFTN